MAAIDLRDEPSLWQHEETASAASGYRDTHASLFRVHDDLSPNALRALATMQSPKFRWTLGLADQMERGESLSDDGLDHVCQEMPPLADLAIDLFNMVSRRDELIVELRAEIAKYEAAEYDAQQG